MPYDERLADRVKQALGNRRGLVEKKMFGGLAFMLNGNMCCGVERKNLVLRVGPGNYEAVLKRDGARPMDFTGRPLKGFIYVAPRAVQKESALKKWLEPALSFAQSLPKK